MSELIRSALDAGFVTAQKGIYRQLDVIRKTLADSRRTLRLVIVKRDAGRPVGTRIHSVKTTVELDLGAIGQRQTALGTDLGPRPLPALRFEATLPVQVSSQTLFPA